MKLWLLFSFLGGIACFWGSVIWNGKVKDYNFVLSGGCMGNTVTICFANNKGGSGKSTSCSNVGAALAGMGKKVLLVDGDMQLNLSLSFFDEEEVLKMAARRRISIMRSVISRI